MSVEGSDKPRRRRRLTEDEHKLWSGVARSVVPLKRKPAGPHHHESISASGEPPPPARHPVSKPAAKPSPKPVLPVLPLERRAKQPPAAGSEPNRRRLALHRQD